jgi:hypothetical protein
LCWRVPSVAGSATQPGAWITVHSGSICSSSSS